MTYCALVMMLDLYAARDVVAMSRISVPYTTASLCRLLLTRYNGALHVYDHGSATWPRALPKLTDRGARSVLLLPVM